MSQLAFDGTMDALLKTTQASDITTHKAGRNSSKLSQIS